MKSKIIDISNLDLPVAHVIREALSVVPKAKRKDILGTLSEDEFVSQQVDVYLHELEAAMHAGHDELGAKEIALKECLHAIRQDDGEVFKA